MPAKARSGYSKVRKGFCVRKSPQNQPLETTTTNIAEEPVTPTLNTSASSQKIQPIVAPKSCQSSNINGYILVDKEILADLFKLMMCPSCQQCNITLVEAPLKKQGLSTLLTLKCSSCDFAKENYSSRRVNKNKSFDINLRIVYTMRACGLGYAGIQNFTSLMNMPSPMTANNYDKLVKIIAPIVKNVAMDTMSDAVEDLKDKVNNNNDILDTAVSVDGTWQRRGYCSLNGVVPPFMSKMERL